MTERACQYDLDDPAQRVSWLREMHDLALGIAQIGDETDRADRIREVDRAYSAAKSFIRPALEIWPGIVSKLAGVDIGARYRIGDTEYASADQAIAVLCRLCDLISDAMQSVVSAGVELYDSVEAAGLDMTKDGNAKRDARMRDALIQAMQCLNEYERLTRREKDDKGCTQETTENES